MVNYAFLPQKLIPILLTSFYLMECKYLVFIRIVLYNKQIMTFLPNVFVFYQRLFPFWLKFLLTMQVETAAAIDEMIQICHRCFVLIECHCIQRSMYENVDLLNEIT